MTMSDQQWTFGIKPGQMDRLLSLGREDPGPAREDEPETPSMGLIERPGERIGRYGLLRILGEGGMGVVYLAEQTEPIHRQVALKIIKLGMDTRQVIARFEAERQALALMDHPNIARVLDAGTTQTGRPYFVMELVPGVSITEYCDKNNLCARDRLMLFLQVCSAVQHAHTKGIIHRDLKPSNVLVTLVDGTPVPKIIDFGIAKATDRRLTEKTLLTRSGHIIGTPAYMSPEQAELSNLEVDTRSDVYSLGVLLYELLTGTTPFSAEELRKAGYIEMQRVIREQEPVKPSTKLGTLGGTLTDVAKRRNSTPDLLRKAIRGDLDWIVMKCLEKDRAHRYETANSLMMDVEHHLTSEPVTARPPSTLYRFQKLVRRNKGVFAAAAAVAAALVIGLVVSVVSLVHEQHARRIAVAAQAKETALRYASDISLAQQALAMNDLGQARQLLEDHRSAPGQADLRHWEWRYLWQQCRSDAVEVLHRYTNEAYSVAYSPDGKLLAVAGLIPGFVDIWDVPGHKRILTLQPDEGQLVAFSPRGDLLATGAGQQIRLWRTGTWDLVGQFDLAGFIQVLTFSPDGTRLAALVRPGQVAVWALDRRTVIYQNDGVRLGDASVGKMQFSPDGRALIIGDWRGRLQVINLASGTTDVGIADAHPEGITSVAWSPNGSVIASGSGFSGGPVRLWEAASGKLLGELKGHSSWICNLVFSADGQRLYSASADQTIRIWDVERRQRVATLRGSTDVVYGLALSPDGTTLASGSKDGVVAFWNALAASDEERPGRTTLSQFGYGMAAFAPDSRVLAVRRNVTVNDANARVVSILDLSTCDEIERLPWSGDGVAAIRYSPDGALLVIGGWGRSKVRVWSCAEHRQLQEWDHSDAPIPLLHFQSDGRRLLAVDAKGKGIWWDTVTWQPARTFVLTSVWPSAGRISVSPDSRLMAQGTDTGAVRWLDGETGELLATVTNAHRATVQGITFSAEGSRAASVARDGTVALWDPSSFRVIASFKGHMQGAHAVAFSPDGLRLATGGSGRDSVRLWDLSTQPPRRLLTLSGEGSLFNSVAFSPDGKWLMATAQAQPHGMLHLWHAPTWEEIEAAEKSPHKEQSR